MRVHGALLQLCSIFQSPSIPWSFQSSFPFLRHHPNHGRALQATLSVPTQNSWSDWSHWMASLHRQLAFSGKPAHPRATSSYTFSTFLKCLWLAPLTLRRYGCCCTLLRENKSNQQRTWVNFRLQNLLILRDALSSMEATSKGCSIRQLGSNPGSLI